MMESNAEMYRVEDTMSRLLFASGSYRLVSYVTQTGLFIDLIERRRFVWSRSRTDRSI